MIDFNKIDCEYINTEKGLKRFSGNVDMYSKCLLDFAKDNSSIANLSNAITNGEYKTAFVYAHNFKGSCGNLELTKCFETIVILTEALRKLDAVDLKKVISAFGQFRKCYINTVSEIELASGEKIF